ncbi:MAG: exlusion protein FxsA [Planctomyces sp.]|nr:exlusion protein FxsA [Planctomyces sp.]
MFFRLLLLFTLVPFIELTLLIKLSEWHGFGTTVLLILATGLLGTFLARRQGFQVWWKIRQEMSKGQPPTDSLLEGLCILVAGALLITPGVLTDVVGFLLLWPAFRGLLMQFAKYYLVTHARTAAGRGFTVFQTGTQFPNESRQNETANQRQPQPSRRPSEAEIIDVEFTRKDPPESGQS